MEQTCRKRVVIFIKIMCVLRTETEHPSGLKNVIWSCTVEFIVRNIFTNYPLLLNVEKCLNGFHIEKKKTCYNFGQVTYRKLVFSE